MYGQRQACRNRNRPRDYKTWLRDDSCPINEGTLRSRAAKQRRIGDDCDDCEESTTFDSSVWDGSDCLAAGRNVLTAPAVGARREDIVNDQLEYDHSATVPDMQEPVAISPFVNIDHSTTVPDTQHHTASSPFVDIDELLPDGKSTLYQGSTVTKNDLCLLVMAFSLRHKLTSAATKDLLALINLIVPGCIPSSNYLLDKLFSSSTCSAVLQYYCSNSNCMQYFGTETPRECPQCLQRYVNVSDSYMLVLPLEQQLREVLQNFPTEPLSSIPNQLIKDVSDGSSYQKLKRNRDDISLQFNCDGSPIFNSSKFSIWPLLCTINELPPSVRNNNVILHTLWFGKEKPKAVTYLQPFISEVTVLHAAGFSWVNHCTKTTVHTYVSAALCICDAPARAMVQDFTQFNGIFGCGFCYHTGQQTEKGNGFVRVYPRDDTVGLRTHEQTLAYAEAATESETAVKGVKGCSALFLLPQFDIIQSFVPEYMHSVLLGVVRQFVNIWTDSSNHSQPFYLKNTKVIDSFLDTIKPPEEVRRLPRSLQERKFWKASEYRNFLLFYSPVVLMHTLPKVYYMHWLLLVFALSNLLHDEITEVMIKDSHACLCKFVADVVPLYGIEYVSYNVHLLTHLAEAVKRWGPLWAHSAFVFEDSIGLLKTVYHGTQVVPKQVIKYFTGWKMLTYYTPLLLGASQDVLDLFDNLSSSRRSVSSPTKVGAFVGLGSQSLRKLNVSELVAVNNSLTINVSGALSLPFYQRFIIGKHIFTTSDYCQRFKRNNSFILLDSGEHAKLMSCCVFVNNCVCTSGSVCNCVQVILFVKCCTVSNVTSTCTSLGTNLTTFLYKMQDDEGHLLAVTPDNVVGKCICITNASSTYLLTLPKHVLE